MGDKHGAGKGDRYRPVDQDRYRENYEKIFGKAKTNGRKDSNRKTNNRRGTSNKGGAK